MNQIYTPKQALNIDDEYVDNIDDVEEEEELTVADIIGISRNTEYTKLQV